VICGDPGGWFYGNEYINHPDHRAAAAAALEAIFPCAEMELLWPDLGKPHKVHAVYVRGSQPLDTWIDIGDNVQAKINALKCHVSQFPEWDPSPMVQEWAIGEAKNARKQFRASKNGKRPTLKRGAWKYAEAFHVMVLQNDEA
jgi:LmbE family N-acetylglucosaminyl deacetylase